MASEKGQSPPCTPQTMDKPDAGLRSLNHYRNKLPAWRYRTRQALISLVRWETQYLASVQEKVRCPALDSYFAITANLGTHTFFMLALPLLAWCGYTNLFRVMIHTLASGVFFTGVLKDLLCLPRPLSPPLYRISMSRSAALEYGFPSTHSTNALSVVVYSLFALNSPDSMTHPKVKLILEVLLFVYTTSIVLGRLYCGMHGFFDVFIGSVLGAILSLVQWFYGDALDHFIYTGSFTAPIIVTLIILLLVRVHPEPADDCPCFDDSVAFAGVAIGAELGYWHYSHSGLAWDFPVPATTPFQLEVLGWPKTIARIAVGIVMILAWREVMKPTLLRLLPPVFRVVEKLGLSLPRKFFVQASEYKRVPKHLKDDDMMPSVSEIPSLLTSMRHPRRTRSVSVGPQSEADAYETMAYREKRRKEDASSFAANTTADFRGNLKNDSPGYFGMNTSDHSSDKPPISGLLPTPASSNVDLYRQMLGTDPVLYTPLTPNSEKAIDGSNSHRGSEDRRRYEKEEREMFSNLEKPRVRYDVEVITKLIVYAGIALIAVEGGPVVFDIIGLGFGKQTA